MTPFACNGAPAGLAHLLARWRGRFLASVLALVLLSVAASPALAVSTEDFPPQAPPDHVLDGAAALSRASSQELERLLEGFEDERVDARLITVSRVDDDLNLQQLGDALLTRWQSAEGGRDGSAAPLLLLLIDAQTRSTAVVASPRLGGRLPVDLLRSTADTTMAWPLRSADRYRQASLDALTRLGAVLRGGEDPGEPEQEEAQSLASNIPSREETKDSNAFTWIVVLLVVGTVVPMATWWVFSR